MFKKVVMAAANKYGYATPATTCEAFSILIKVGLMLMTDLGWGGKYRIVRPLNTLFALTYLVAWVMYPVPNNIGEIVRFWLYTAFMIVWLAKAPEIWARYQAKESDIQRAIQGFFKSDPYDGTVSEGQKEGWARIFAFSPLSVGLWIAMTYTEPMTEVITWLTSKKLWIKNGWWLLIAVVATTLAIPYAFYGSASLEIYKNMALAVMVTLVILGTTFQLIFIVATIADSKIARRFGAFLKQYTCFKLNW